MTCKRKSKEISPAKTFLAAFALFGVWGSYEEPTTVLPSSAQVMGCYVTSRWGQGPLYRGRTVIRVVRKSSKEQVYLNVFNNFPTAIRVTSFLPGILLLRVRGSSQHIHNRK
jgi:hypothetical protein